MLSCTFFGHRECPEKLRSVLRIEIEEMVKRGVTMFYIGNHGRFDAMARSVLREMNLNYAVVLAYMPGKTQEYEDYADTMFPEKLEGVPKRFAISCRNRWLVDNCDYVIAYVAHDWGGAAQYAELAEKKGKTVINLAGSRDM